MWLISAAIAAPIVFAIGDVVNVRAAPGAATVARVPIGTRLEVQEKRDGWVRVAVPARPGLKGWVAAELVADQFPDTRDLVARAADGEPWLTRARALDPWDPDVQRVAGMPAPGAWLAQCDGSRVWLVGHLDDSGFTDGTQTTDGRFLSSDVRERRMRQLAASTWYTVFGPVERGWFAAPFSAPLASIEEGADADGWHTDAVMNEGTPQVIALGGCTPYQRGTVFATAPLTPLTAAPVHTAALASFLPALGADISGLIAATGPEEGTEILTYAMTPVPSCTDGEDAVDVGTFWRWRSPDGAFTEPFRVTMGRDGGGASWFRLGDVTAGLLFGEDLTAVSTLVRVDRGGRARLDHVVIREHGC